MYHTLLHIYGPIGIHSFGLFFAIGILICLYLAQRSKRRQELIPSARFTDAIILSIMIGIAGSRVLYVIQEWHSFDSWTEVFNVWSGGLSLLGVMPAIIIFLPLYLRHYKIPVVPFFDLLALYGPLLQSISRIGCFFAGCCFGHVTNVSWAVSYSDPDSIAPLCMPLHPAQLYSSALLFLIFLFLYFCAQYRYKKPGSIVCLYLMLLSVERIVIDFFRGDREYFSPDYLRFFSIHQWIACAIFVAATIGWLYLNVHQKPKSSAP